MELHPDPSWFILSNPQNPPECKTQRQVSDSLVPIPAFSGAVEIIPSFPVAIIVAELAEIVTNSLRFMSVFSKTRVIVLSWTSSVFCSRFQ
jgi:hypothetical protein